MILLDGIVAEADAIAWSPDGQALAVAGKASFVELWDVGTRTARRVLDSLGPHRAAVFADGQLVTASARGRVCAHPLRAGDQAILPLASTSRHAAIVGGIFVFAGLARFLPLLAGLSLPGLDNLWESNCRRGAAQYEPFRLCPCPGGLLAVGTQFDCYLIDPATGAFARKLGNHTLGTPALAARPDGAVLAVATATEILLLPLERTSRRPLARVAQRKHFTDVAFHPSGRFLLASSADGTVRTLDQDLKETAAFDWGIGPVRRVAFAADGMRAAAAGNAGLIAVWDMDC